MQRHFDEELKALYNQILKMSTMAEEAIYKSVEALKQRNKPMAEEIIRQDEIIDEMELAIDEQCLDLIACRQPVAQDLRFITMAMKINTDLERIGDLAVDMAQRTLELLDKPQLKPLVDIPKLAGLAQEMVHGAIESFISRDINRAKEVILKDNEADNLKNMVQKELIDDYMVKDASTAPRAVALLLIARHLERICDHATNIAEDVIYVVQARVVKHGHEKLDNSV